MGDAVPIVTWKIAVWKTSLFPDGHADFCECGMQAFAVENAQLMVAIVLRNNIS